MLMNANQTNGAPGGRPSGGARGPQAKVFGIPEGTDHVCLPWFLEVVDPPFQREPPFLDVSRV